MKHLRSMKQILVLPIIFALFLMPVLAQNRIVLNQRQAVAVAEKFVAKNGYTDNSMGITDVIKGKQRNLNLIEPQAVIAFIKKVGEQSVWSVQFLLKEQDYEKQERIEQRGNKKLVITYDFGREVRMSLDGRKVWIESYPIAVKEATIFGDCTSEDEKVPSTEKP